jgi:GR25 family glycosyltransferase involved in LPS biosynthesis
MSRSGYLKMDKLKGFGPVYLINLKDHTHRLKNAQKEFAKYGVTDYTVIEAVDGRTNDLSSLIAGQYPRLKPSEIGCVMSHIKALKHWLETSDSEYAIIMEDDFSFDTVQFWQWDWKYVQDNIPKDADIVQLVMIKNDPVTFSLHKKQTYHRKNNMTYSWSTACYLIKRQYAQNIVDIHFAKEKYRLPHHGFKNQAADVVLYNLGNTYSIPLFTHILDLKNSINEKHGTFHSRSKQNIDNWWKNNSMNYSKDQFFDLKNGLTLKKNTKKGCFNIFHAENNSQAMKKRNELVEKAHKQLIKDFDHIETPTFIMKSPEDVQRFYSKEKMKVYPLGHFKTGWKPGELGIWASNYTAWKNFLKTDYDYMILMEDDIVLTDSFNSKLAEYLDEIPDNWDVFTAYIPTFGNVRYEKRKDELLIGKENVCKVYQSWSCLCYVISRSGAERLMREVRQTVKSPLDHYLFYHRGLNVYTLKMENENICSLFETESTVQEAQRYDMTGYV